MRWACETTEFVWTSRCEHFRKVYSRLSVPHSRWGHSYTLPICPNKLRKSSFIPIGAYFVFFELTVFSITVFTVCSAVTFALVICSNKESSRVQMNCKLCNRSLLVIVKILVGGIIASAVASHARRGHWGAFNKILSWREYYYSAEMTVLSACNIGKLA